MTDDNYTIDYIARDGILACHRCGGLSRREAEEILKQYLDSQDKLRITGLRLTNQLIMSLEGIHKGTLKESLWTFPDVAAHQAGLVLREIDDKKEQEDGKKS